MSSPSSTPATTPKAMSSRLLTMKFMQRAAASTPTSSSPTPDEPSPKRQKKNSDSPIWPKLSVDSLADRRAIQAALDAEEAKRQAALDKQAAEAGDTRWVLSFEDQEKSARVANGGLRIIQTGFASLDVPTPQQIKPMDDDDFGDRPAMVGRRSFAKFNKALEKEQGTLSESSDSDSDSSSEAEESSESDNAEADANDPMKELIRATRHEAAQKLKAERRAKRKAERAHLDELSKKRKKKEVKLNTNMTSLTGRQDRPDTRTCFLCGGPHLKIDCPRNQNGSGQKRFFQGGDDGPLPKARKVR